jgi:hypothetical protein
MNDKLKISSVLYSVALAGSLWLGALPVSAGTVAYWRFEEGPDLANVSHGGQPDGVFYPGTADSSGNGYALSVWAEGWAGYAYRANVGMPTVALSGTANNFSVKNTGGFPALFTQTGTALQTWQPAAWSVEAAFKLENGGYKTIVGRDSRGSATINGDLAAMYFQAVPNNGLAVKYCDVAGYWHEAVSANNAYIGFDYPTDPDGNLAPWYAMTATSDGSTLSLYLRNLTVQSGWDLIAQTDLIASGSSNTALTAGVGSAGDWAAGNFSVGRGLYAGGHGDRAYGYIDEVRLSDSALGLSEFLFVPEPGTFSLVLLGGCMLLFRRFSPRA